MARGGHSDGPRCYLRSGRAAEEVVAGIEAAGGRAMAVQADVREAAAVENIVERVGAAWGGIDVLVHNALIPYVVKSFQDMTWEELGSTPRCVRRSRSRKPSCPP
ncbi:SDR family NAD(P)-dependent oxidoreductase [Streptomyces sp. NPDC058691]|uniref:SDR family NAD(P)-dependent oxidoreductase n=1 Tax=Streptomyces sp. NPDC058691 TaxID=3346601 RepID=UPI0036674FAD